MKPDMFEKLIQKSLPPLVVAMMAAGFGMYTDIQLLKQQVEQNAEIAPLVQRLDKRLAVTNERLAIFAEFVSKGRPKNGI